jgi:hypothetical protein
LQFRGEAADETIDKHFKLLGNLFCLMAISGPYSMNIRTCFLRFATPFLLLPYVLSGQTAVVAPVPVLWQTITAENTSTAVVLPAGTTYRFGDYANNKWSAPITVTEPTTFSPVSLPSGVFPFTDPDLGVVKELDVLETAAAQAILVTNLATSPATTVSQIVPPLAASTPVPLASGSAHTLTFSSFSIAPDAGSNALMLALVNEPPTMAYRTWEGTQMTLTIDGVTLTCTYGQTFTDQVFTLNCTLPPAPIPGP